MIGPDTNTSPETNEDRLPHNFVVCGQNTKAAAWRVNKSIELRFSCMGGKIPAAEDHLGHSIHEGHEADRNAIFRRPDVAAAVDIDRSSPCRNIGNEGDTARRLDSALGRTTILQNQIPDCGALDFLAKEAVWGDPLRVTLPIERAWWLQIADEVSGTSAGIFRSAGMTAGLCPNAVDRAPLVSGEDIEMITRRDHRIIPRDQEMCSAEGPGLQPIRCLSAVRHPSR